MVRSVRNNFAPINRIPPEVLSLIPDHLCSCHMDEGIIALTHVCQGWRELFISRSSLWTSLDCTNVGKTRVYIERSKTSPVGIHLEKSYSNAYRSDALLLAAAHINRLRSLTVCGSSGILPDLEKHFSCPAPLLRKLKINFDFDRSRAPSFPMTLFNGDLSGLRDLSLVGLTTNLPWRNLANLTCFKLSHFPATVDPPFVTRLLDFLESAPLLSEIYLLQSIPISSNAPPERLISLPHLTNLTTISQLTQSALLNHLSIPKGALLVVEFGFSGTNSPIPDNLPKTLNNLNNLSHITEINMSLDTTEKAVRLRGPSGELQMYGTWTAGNLSSHVLERRFFRSLDKFNLSKVRSLVLTKFTAPSANEIQKTSVFQTLLLMKDLRTLTLIKCNNLAFIRALDPEENTSGTILCPDLQELTLYVTKLEWFYPEQLVEMAADRDLGQARLSSVTIVSLDEMCSKKEVFKLRKYVSDVEYKLDTISPKWDFVPGNEGDRQVGRVVYDDSVE